MASNINFRIVPHSHIQGVEVVEVLLGGQVCAVIYPDRESPGSIKLVSAHFAGDLTRHGQFPDGVKMDTGEKSYPPIPFIHISFDPRTYKIGARGIERV